MINAIVKGIFFLITKLFDFLLRPVVLVVMGLFPDLSDLFNHLSYFLNMAFTYVRSILSLFLINDSMITALFDYFIILYSIYVVSLSVRFALNVYNKLKI